MALTQSIQSLFGAKVANAKLGFLYNNYLRTCLRRPHPCQLGPRCSPRSNAAPTLVLRRRARTRDGAEEWAPLLILGAAGSRRITSSILQVITAVVDRHMSLEEALACPRIHGQENGKVRLERPGLTDPLRQRLSRTFHTLVLKPPRSYSMGSVQAILVDEAGRMTAAADPRRDGAVVVWKREVLEP